MRPIMIALVTLAVLCSMQAAHGSLLHFRNSSDVALGGPSWGTLEANAYGDNVNATFIDANYSYGSDYGATPNVTVAVDQPSAFTYNSGSAFPSGTGSLVFPFVSDVNLTLTAAVGYQVKLERFDVATFNTFDLGAGAIKVYLDGSATAAYTASNTAFTAATPYSYRQTGGPQENWSTPLVGSSVRLAFTGSPSQFSNTAISFIGFSQLVPEPASFTAMMICGLAILSRQRRSRAG